MGKAGQTPIPTFHVNHPPCHRDEVLGTTLADFHAFADVLESVRDKGQVVAVTSPDKAAAAEAERPGFFAQTLKVL